MTCKSVYSDDKHDNELCILGSNGLQKCHLCMVTLTAGAVACALAGVAGGCLQGGPPTGAFSHGFGVEGVTRPI